MPAVKSLPSTTTPIWTAEGVWIPTQECGLVDLMAYFQPDPSSSPQQCNSRRLSLKARPEWSDFSNRRPLIQFIKDACRQAGFVVASNGCLKNRLRFVCAHTRKVWYKTESSSKSIQPTTATTTKPENTPVVCRFQFTLACGLDRLLLRHTPPPSKKNPKRPAVKPPEPRVLKKQSKRNEQTLSFESTSCTTTKPSSTSSPTPKEKPILHWKPEEVWLPTDSGSMNIMKYIGHEQPKDQSLSTTTKIAATPVITRLVPLQQRPEWCQNVATDRQCRIRFIQTVREACLEAGFAVVSGGFRVNRQYFICAQTKKLWNDSPGNNRRAPTTSARLVDGSSNSTCNSRPPLSSSAAAAAVVVACPFKFSISWVPNQKCWSFHGGHGIGVHKGHERLEISSSSSTSGATSSTGSKTAISWKKTPTNRLRRNGA